MPNWPKSIEEIEGKLPAPGAVGACAQLFATALETPGGLKIQTIHAFCEALLHQFPLEANIAGHFEMLDHQMEAALIGEARRDMISGAAARDNRQLADAFATVLERGGETGLDNLLGEIVQKRDRLRDFIRQTVSLDEPFEDLFEEFGFRADESAQSIAASVWPDRYFGEAFCEEFLRHAEQAGKRIAAGFCLQAARSVPHLRSFQAPGAASGYIPDKEARRRMAASKRQTNCVKGSCRSFPRLCRIVRANGDGGTRCLRPGRVVPHAGRYAGRSDHRRLADCAIRAAEERARVSRLQ